jgi:hypothetical protein
MGEKGKSLGLSAAELEGADTVLSNLFGTKPKDNSSKGKGKGKSKGEATGEEFVLKGYSDKDLEKLDKSEPITLKKKSALSAVKIPTPSKTTTAAEPVAPAASIIEKSKLGMKETSSKLSAEKAKSAKEEKAATATAVAASEADKPKEKKSSTSKLGSIKLNPSALAALSSKPKSDDK